MNDLLNRILSDCAHYPAQGHVATYIPELATVDPSQIGIFVSAEDGSEYYAGDCFVPFTMQSVVKTLILLQALMDSGIDAVRALVGVEATGKPFDAINMTDQTLLSENINPMVNMGAIAMCSLIKGDTYEERIQRVLALTRKLAGNEDIHINTDVYLSEKRTGNKNRALGFLLKSYGMIQDEDVEGLVDCYFQACSIQVSSKDLAHIGYVLASRGKLPQTDERVFPSQYATYVNAILMTCGMYDGSGEFAVKVGLPAKSGVGGGIMAVAPTRMGIGIFSPGLDEKGNSVAGIKVLEKLSKRMYLSIF